MREVGTYPIGEKIKAARESAKISRVDMARKLGQSRQTFNYLETGQVDPRFSTLLKLAVITNKPLSFFHDILPCDSQELEKLTNSSRNQGIIFACTKLAELYDRVDLAQSLIETIGITIDCGREKDAKKLKEIISRKSSE